MIMRGCRHCQRNRERVRGALKTLRVADLDANDLEMKAMDLVANLMHLADSRGWDVNFMVGQAQKHYWAEIHDGEEHGT